MIDRFRTKLNSHVDTMAERVVQLAARRSARRRLSPGLRPPLPIHSSTDHLAALVDLYAKLAGSPRAAIDATQEAGDADTADLFTAFSRAAVVPGSASSGA